MIARGMEGHDHQRSMMQIPMLRVGDVEIDVEEMQGGPGDSDLVQETFYDGTTIIRGTNNDLEGGERKDLAHLPRLHRCELKSLQVGSQHTPSYKVDDKIELLCQDSGIRGCWFRCTVLQSSQKWLKVRYDDVLNEDESKNLEEWVPAFMPATSDKLGMRCPGRLTIRPYPTHNYLSDDVAFQIGTPVDSWWNDGWWEGVVIGVKSCGDDNVQVYLPGEGTFLECQRRDLRISLDWIRNQWVDVDVKPNILSAISMVGSGSTSGKGAESGSSAMPDRGIRVVEADGKTEGGW